MHYWANLQSMHGFHCYDNIGLDAKCQRVLVLALCVVISSSQVLNGMQWLSHVLSVYCDDYTW